MCEDVASPDAQEMNDALADDNIEPVEALTAVHVHAYACVLAYAVSYETCDR